MNLRTLLLSFALAGTACTVAVPSQFPCTHPGSTSECGTSQICGNDNLCTRIVDCGKGQARCNGNCIDITTDPNNCGYCAGLTSPAGVVCSVSCPTGETKCGAPAQCVNTTTDRNNCGTCGSICAAGHICQSGNCQTLSCPDPLVDCGTGTCINPNIDAANCGFCAGLT